MRYVRLLAFTLKSAEARTAEWLTIDCFVCERRRCERSILRALDASHARCLSAHSRKDLQANTRLVPIYHDGTFNDRGFHRGHVLNYSEGELIATNEPSTDLVN